MKTLGQIAYDASHDNAGWLHWKDLFEGQRAQYEASAQAVRAAVIEEMAQVVDAEQKKNDGWTEQEAEDERIASLLRSLK